MGGEREGPDEVCVHGLCSGRTGAEGQQLFDQVGRLSSLSFVRPIQTFFFPLATSARRYSRGFSGSAFVQTFLARERSFYFVALDQPSGREGILKDRNLLTCRYAGCDSCQHEALVGGEEGEEDCDR